MIGFRFNGDEKSKVFSVGPDNPPMGELEVSVALTVSRTEIEKAGGLSNLEHRIILALSEMVEKWNKKG